MKLFYLFCLLVLYPSLSLAQRFVSVCDRTPQVRRAIMEEMAPFRGAGLSHCSEVRAYNLNNIVVLDLANARITSLRNGDFSGFSSLEVLDLGNNRLRSLPREVFAGMMSLEWLYLGNNELRGLPAGVFSGLPLLNYVDLSGNPLDRSEQALISRPLSAVSVNF